MNKKIDSLEKLQKAIAEPQMTDSKKSESWLRHADKSAIISKRNVTLQQIEKLSKKIADLTDNDISALTESENAREELLENLLSENKTEIKNLIEDLATAKEATQAITKDLDKNISRREELIESLASDEDKETLRSNKIAIKELTDSLKITIDSENEIAKQMTNNIEEEKELRAELQNTKDRSNEHMEAIKEKLFANQDDSKKLSKNFSQAVAEEKKIKESLEALKDKKNELELNIKNNNMQNEDLIKNDEQRIDLENRIKVTKESEKDIIKNLDSSGIAKRELENSLGKNKNDILNTIKDLAEKFSEVASIPDNVKKLDIDIDGKGGALSEENVGQIVNLLKNPMFEINTLKLVNCQLNDGHIKTIMDALMTRNREQIEVIDFSGNKIGFEGVAAIASALNTSKVEFLDDLNLNDNNIGDAGITELTEAVLRHRQVGNVNCTGGNNISTKGAETIINQLKNYDTKNTTARASFNIEIKTDNEKEYEKLEQLAGSVKNYGGQACITINTRSKSKEKSNPVNKKAADQESQPESFHSKDKDGKNTSSELNNSLLDLNNTVKQIYEKLTSLNTKPYTFEVDILTSGAVNNFSGIIKNLKELVDKLNKDITTKIEANPKNIQKILTGFEKTELYKLNEVLKENSEKKPLEVAYNLSNYISNFNRAQHERATWSGKKMLESFTKNMQIGRGYFSLPIKLLMRAVKNFAIGEKPKATVNLEELSENLDSSNPNNNKDNMTVQTAEQPNALNKSKSLHDADSTEKDIVVDEQFSSTTLTDSESESKLQNRSSLEENPNNNKEDIVDDEQNTQTESLNETKKDVENPKDIENPVLKNVDTIYDSPNTLEELFNKMENGDYGAPQADNHIEQISAAQNLKSTNNLTADDEVPGLDDVFDFLNENNSSNNETKEGVENSNNIENLVSKNSDNPPNTLDELLNQIGNKDNELSQKENPAGNKENKTPKQENTGSGSKESDKLTEKSNDYHHMSSYSRQGSSIWSTLNKSEKKLEEKSPDVSNTTLHTPR